MDLTKIAYELGVSLLLRDGSPQAKIEAVLNQVIAERDRMIATCLDYIEQVAGERHLVHGANFDAFWGCSRPQCKRASKFLREQPKYFECKARYSGTAGGNPPQDCDWPMCGCDPVANRVLSSIHESGLEIVKKDNPPENSLI